MRFGPSCGRVVVAGACVAVLALGAPTLIVAQPAKQTSAEVRQKAAEENARLEELVAQLNTCKSEVEGLDQQIKDLAQQSIVVQGYLIEDRSQLRKMVKTDYRAGGMPSLWDIALSSDTFDDFVSRIYYANKVTQWQTGCVERLNEDKHDLEERMDAIEAARNERRTALGELESTCAELTESVNALLELASGLEAQERAAEEARLAEIARQAALEQQRAQKERAQAQAEAEMRQLAAVAATDAASLEAEAEEDDARAAAAKLAAQEATTKDADDEADELDATDEDATADDLEDADTESEDTAGDDASADDADAGTEADEASDATATDEEDVDDEPETEPDSEPEAAPDPELDAEPEPEPEPEPVPEPAPEPEPVAEEPAPEPATEDAGDWIYCIASAYTIADNTPPGSTATASGIPLDESVPTVAMPISIDPARFYGSMIQIEYEGMTVIATVTDCGGMGGGSRGLDLTPAVFRAFGAETGDEWGLREVRYRFL
ncbi:MAG: hypothetical protein IKF14_08490 [Atopobiaceae bacterium]|nr:hypothetical protein [Atopobiaceae bacterium]